MMNKYQAKSRERKENDSAAAFSARNVPDFAKLHAMEQARRDKFKEANKKTGTRAQPFALTKNDSGGMVPKKPSGSVTTRSSTAGAPSYTAAPSTIHSNGFSPSAPRRPLIGNYLNGTTTAAVTAAAKKTTTIAHSIGSTTVSGRPQSAPSKPLLPSKPSGHVTPRTSTAGRAGGTPPSHATSTGPTTVRDSDGRSVFSRPTTAGTSGGSGSSAPQQPLVQLYLRQQPVANGSTVRMEHRVVAAPAPSSSSVPASPISRPSTAVARASVPTPPNHVTGYTISTAPDSARSSATDEPPSARPLAPSTSRPATSPATRPSTAASSIASSAHASGTTTPETRHATPQRPSTATTPSYYADSSAATSGRASPAHPRDMSSAGAPDLKRLIGQTIAAQGCSTSELYTFGKTLGEGAYGKVKQGTHVLTGELVAVKTFEKSKLVDVNARKRVAREIRIMKSLSHANIVKLFEVIDSPTRKYLVIEYSEGGDLCKHVRANRRLTESAAASILAQIVEGLQYCHKNNIVHRDIKLDNLLLDANNRVKIVDFGFSVEYKDGVRLKKACGSPSYAAPEIVSRTPYLAPGIDVWSLGVVLYAMVCGYFPFQGTSNQDLCKKIVRGKYETPSFMSIECRDLVRRMLTTEPSKRITLDQVRTHPWLKMYVPLPADHVERLQAQVDEARNVDEDLIAELVAMGFPRPFIMQSIINNQFNSATASYWMLQKRKAVARDRDGHGAVVWTVGVNKPRPPTGSCID